MAKPPPRVVAGRAGQAGGVQAGVYAYEPHTHTSRIRIRAARYGTYEGTTWPIPWSNDPNEDGIEWQLRYGPNKDFFLASIVSAYSGLLDPSLTQKDASAMLRRARRAVHGSQP